jgi:phage terminase large subunit-like protein
MGLAQQLSSISPVDAASAISALSDEQALAFLYDWKEWARENQIFPAGDWQYWLIKAGRGFGKSRTGAESVREAVCGLGCKRIALVGRTAADCRDTMIEGESGLLSVFPPWQRPIYEPSKRRITFHNGAIATAYSAEKPDALRGPQHDFAWCDELAAWKYDEAWDQLLFGLRLGVNPRAVISTTPRPTKIIREILKDPLTVVSSGTTYDNANNLAPSFLNAIIKKYEGTRLGRQEIQAELLEDNPEALWQRGNIDELRVKRIPTDVELVQMVVGVDPAVTSNKTSDSTGIVTAAKGDDGHYYVLGDATLKDTPKKWAGAAIHQYKLWEADYIIGEVNNGGDLVKEVIETVDQTVPFKSVRASRGKTTRAEPISALYEKGLVHHVGVFAKLEDEMCEWMPGEKSPDRMDALVWALTELLGASDILIA